MTWVIVSGDRLWANQRRLFSVLDLLHADHKFKLVIEGEAPGADKMARKWAEKRGVDVLPMAADWDRFHRAAGPIRNRAMLKELLKYPGSKLVVAFHNNLAESKGTKDMVTVAMKAPGVAVNMYSESGTILLPGSSAPRPKRKLRLLNRK